MRFCAVLSFTLALALAVSATMPAGSGPSLETGTRGSNTRTEQRIALAALDPIVDAPPCVFRGSYCDPQVPCCARYQYWYGNVSGAVSGTENSIFG